MKKSPRQLTILLLALLLAAAITAVALRARAINQLRAENQLLLANSHEAAQLAEQNRDIDRLRAENQEVKTLQVENEDLPRLRNEARQLRRQAADLDQLRAENQQLLARQNLTDTTSTTPLATPANFIPKSALYDAGLVTPEATMQTYFWAMNQGNLERLSQCEVNGADRLNSDRQWELRYLAEHMARFIGFAITDKKELSPTEVELDLQASLGGTQMPMKLHLMGNEWKIEN